MKTRALVGLAGLALGLGACSKKKEPVERKGEPRAPRARKAPRQEKPQAPRPRPAVEEKPGPGVDLPKVGDVVWAQWKPNSWYHGKVDATCDLGLHVAFDDGDKACLPAGLVVVDRPPAAPAAVKPGTRVLARWRGGKLYPGTVAKAAGGKYDIRFDDGDKATVGLADLRLMPPVTSVVAAKVGDVVWAQWKPNSWYHGKVDATCDLGLHVAFDDGDKACLPAELVVVDRPPAAPAAVKPGTRVLARWRGGRLYPGTVAKAAGGKYDIRFDDGDKATVGLADLRRLAR